jgi:hypothetical protein
VPAGSDPPGIKLRAAKALEAVDYFVPGYWVFSKLIQSLSDIGYDNNNLVRGLQARGGGGAGTPARGGRGHQSVLRLPHLLCTITAVVDVPYVLASG